jgi:hypothetical protein
LDKKRKEHRDRLVVLSFVSVLLVLIYGPAAPWFRGADHFLFDQFATFVRNEPLENAVIVSVNPAKKSADEVTAEYGRVLQVFNAHKVGRVIISQGPEMSSTAELPGWAVTLAGGVPVFAPSDHRLADVVTTTGILDLQPDADNILRWSSLWHLQGGVMSPSLPLSVALQDKSFAIDPQISSERR